MNHVQQILADADNTIGELKMLNMQLDRDFFELPKWPSRLVNLLSEMRGWSTLTKTQKIAALEATGGERDEKTLKRAMRVARRVK